MTDDSIRTAEDRYQAQLEADRQAAAERTARLAELYEQPALGHYRDLRPTTETTLTTEVGGTHGV